MKTYKYPYSRKDDTIVDNYFGTRVSDPYRWLEDDNSAETVEWVSAQNSFTEEILAAIPYREQLRETIKDIVTYPQYGLPRKCGGYYFFLKNDGKQNQAVLYRQKGLAEEAEAFLDPNILDEYGTTALTTFSFSKDEKYIACLLNSAGSDWTEIHVMEVETGQKTGDIVRWVKFSCAVWSDNGFYYSRYDEPVKGAEYSSENKFHKVYFHKLGTLQEEDILIYDDKKHPQRNYSSHISEDGKTLFIHSSAGTSTNEILYKKIDHSGNFKVLFHGFVYDYDVVYCENSKAVIYTNDGADNFRLIEADLSGDEPVITPLVEEQPFALQSASYCGGTLFLSYLKDSSSFVLQYDLQGNLLCEVKLPGIGSVAGFAGGKTDKQVFYSFCSFNYPPTIFSFDINRGKSILFRESEAKIDPADYVVEQHFFTSKDGAKVPMFITYKKGMKKDGRNPVNLYSYGGFNISMTPSFNPVTIMFLNQGGIYAQPSIRGGGDFGEQWHKAGMLENKQNVFDDFIAAAEWLISEKYTNSSKLTISGGSNGGLLVGACMTQRPELFAVAVPRVGVLDMLRYHKFTIGWAWAVEYGSSENKDQFEYLYRYSPLHNIRDGNCYPATLVMTADHDDRVVPAHSFKFAATLQEKQSCKNPVLIRIDSDAGHGAGKPMSKIIDEATDMYSFILWSTGTEITL